MGGIAAPAAQAGISAYNLIEEQKQSNRNMKEISRQQQGNFLQKKNLLEEQLAARRAKLGALGMSSSSSALAVQKREIDNFQTNLELDNQGYRSRIKDIKAKKRLALINAGAKGASAGAGMFNDSKQIM